ncbi:hypothetical protein NESM_000352700 [Novymonas esmeraldas]|uniref:Uncharacterized protein n=1 Tax=Novymonas esmeraldas TaxID=1808958 RepID=A0AAW0EJN0_9TRYP
MPPSVEARAASIGSAPMFAATPVVAPRASSTHDALQEILTNFVTDTMYDRPEDILQYMGAWARKRLLEEEGSAVAAARARKESRLSITPATGAAVSQAAVFAETTADADPVVDAEAANRLLRLAAHRQQQYRDVALGCRDHYLISLEDSDGDMFHLNALQRRMADTRQQEVSARADTAAVVAQLKAIEEGGGTSQDKASQQAALLAEYEQRWASEQPKKSRT